MCRLITSGPAGIEPRVLPSGAARDGLRRQIAAGAGTVLDDDRTAEPRLQGRCKHAGQQIDAAARRKADDKADRGLLRQGWSRHNGGETQ